MIDYPRYTDLCATDRAACECYDLRAAMIRGLGGRVVPMVTERSAPPRKHVKRAPGEGRQYVSRYLGVTRVHGKWAARWEVNRVLKTKLFSTAPEDELTAAWYRTRVLGLIEPEVRR